VVYQASAEVEVVRRRGTRASILEGGNGRNGLRQTRGILEGIRMRWEIFSLVRGISGRLVYAAGWQVVSREIRVTSYVSEMGKRLHA
jgi:hypothetical protein